MKKTINKSMKLLAFLMVFSLLGCFPMQPAFAEGEGGEGKGDETSTTSTVTTTTTETTSTTEATTQQKQGWITKDGKKYYYVDGKKFKNGFKTIKGKKYYFSKKGVMQKNKMVAKNKYVNNKGVLVPKSEIYSYQKKGMKGLEKKLRKMKSGYRGTWCIYVKNLDTNEYLVINNKRMHPASMIKLFCMGSTYNQIKKGNVSKAAAKPYLHSMITVSSNDGYNVLVQKNGGGSIPNGVTKINRFCKKNGYKDTRTAGTLAPSYVAQYHNGLTRSTVKDCGHILEDIYRGNCVSEKYSKEMLGLLKKQTRKSKIPAGLPAGVKSANKTGEVEGEQHDSAIVFSKNADYVIVVMTDNDPSAIGHINSVSRTVYNYFN